VEAAERNVQCVRDGYAVFGRGDLDAALELTQPDIEIDERDALPGGRLYQGHEGLREWLADLVERWSDIRVDIASLEPIDNRVLATVKVSAQGASTGASVTGESFHLWEVEDGRLRRLQVSYDRDSARAAAGLAGPGEGRTQAK
jgi:ketosteroid isomerase-like protein